MMQLRRDQDFREIARYSGTPGRGHVHGQPDDAEQRQLLHGTSGWSSLLPGW